MNPTVVPRMAAEMMTMKASYIKMRVPSALVTPIDLRQPYSHTASFTFWVVAIRRRKKAMVSEMTPINQTRIEKTSLTFFKLSSIDDFSRS